MIEQLYYPNCHRRHHHRQSRNFLHLSSILQLPSLPPAPLIPAHTSNANDSRCLPAPWRRRLMTRLKRRRWPPLKPAPPLEIWRRSKPSVSAPPPPPKVFLNEARKTPSKDRNFGKPRRRLQVSCLWKLDVLIPVMPRYPAQRNLPCVMAWNGSPTVYAAPVLVFFLFSITTHSP